MLPIATVTMNPTIDVSYEVDVVRHTHKMRALAERHAPGGGGINVARVYQRLGGEACCHYLSGGATGLALDGLIAQHRITPVRIAIEQPTRIASAVLETSTGKEYRFTPQGPTVSAAECEACFARLTSVNCAMIVLSGSLPPGVPADFYVRIARRMAERGIPAAIDSSGEALRTSLAAGGFLLAKPSQGELASMVGRPLANMDDIAAAASALVATGAARMIAVTLGHRGALLAREHGCTFLPALAIEAKSAVGAGDSFLAGMIHALNAGMDEIDAFRFGIAAGGAAVLTPGTDLAFPADIHRLYAQVARP